MRWGMVIDLAKCIGCWSCVMACKQEHFLPRDIYWARIATVERGTFPKVMKVLLPTVCNHCEDAPCVEVCPTGATQIRPDGIVHVNARECIGCRSCVIACPYQHRSYLSKIREYNPGQGFTPWEELGRRLYPLEEGTVVKCNFCMEKIDSGIRNGLKPGIDRDATPACVVVCPTRARHFGDLENQEDGLLELIHRKKGFPIRPEFGTRPSVYYLNY